MVVGVSGYGYTGSTAFIQLLMEYKETELMFKKAEFIFPYEVDGLLDLDVHLNRIPSKQSKGDAAIARFLNLIEWNKNFWNKRTNGRFYDLSIDYINSLIQVQYRSRREATRRNNKFQMIYEKFIKVYQRKFEYATHIPLKFIREDVRYISIYPDNFLDKTKGYISALIASSKTREDCIPLIEQPFPPNNPEDVFPYFDDPYAIIVDRDPRDIYLIAKIALKDGRFIPTATVEDFVTYYRAVRKHRPDCDLKRVLRVSFEDLVYNYEKTVKTIEEFLNIKNHVDMKKYFNPEISIRNTQMWKRFPEEKNNIEYIEEHLKEYLFTFPYDSVVADKKELHEMSKW